MKEESLFTGKPTENSLSGKKSKLFLLSFNIHGVLQPEGQAAGTEPGWLSCPSQRCSDEEKLVLNFRHLCLLINIARVTQGVCSNLLPSYVLFCYFKTQTVDKTLKVSVNKDVM